MKHFITASTIAFGLLLAAGLWFLGSERWFEQQTGPSDQVSADDQTNAHGLGMMHGQPSHMGMMGEDMHITSERAFIESMIPHHEEAIATAQEVLERGGTTSGMVAFLKNIISSQTAEVALMKRSYEEWFGVPYTPTEEYRPMMRELEDYDDVLLDQIFLHDMIMHHMGAIMMSRSVQPYLEHDVMRELTSNIIVNQSREIETMQQLFSELQESNDIQ